MIAVLVLVMRNALHRNRLRSIYHINSSKYGSRFLAFTLPGKPFLNTYLDNLQSLDYCPETQMRFGEDIELGKEGGKNP